MKIAYLILAHDAPKHLSRLVRALDSANSTFVIHVDRKSDIAPFRERVSQRNATFLDERVAVYWGEFSIVQATIQLMKTALNHSSCPDYLCLLSGSDYPLRGPDYIDAFLCRNKGCEFINLVPMPCDDVGKRINRLQEYRLQTPQDGRFARAIIARLNRFINEMLKVRRDHLKVLKDMTPYAGSQWWTLTQNASRYILEFIDSRPDVIQFFRNTYLPDESIIHTIIGNSKFSPKAVRNLTFADWSRPNGGPAIIDMDHLNAFVKTERVVSADFYGRGELLFARKFADDSAQLTNFIDRHLINQTKTERSGDAFNGSVATFSKSFS